MTEAFCVPAKRGGRGARPIAMVAIVALCLPGIAHAQADPGPPPATASAVPTIGEAKGFMEENMTAASLLKCPADTRRTIEGSARIELNGGKVLLTSGSSETRKGNDYSTTSTTEQSSISSFNVADVDVKIYRRNNGCQGASLQFACRQAVGNCILTKWTYDPKYYNSDGTTDGTPTTQSRSGSAASAEIGDIAMTLRIIKAFRFYQSQIEKLVPRSAF